MDSVKINQFRLERWVGFCYFFYSLALEEQPLVFPSTEIHAPMAQPQANQSCCWLCFSFLVFFSSNKNPLQHPLNLWTKM